VPYLKEYTQLNPQEARQLRFKRQFKKDHPEWDDSLVLLTRWFDQLTSQGITTLDAGCGHGNWVIDELRDKFTSAIGIDAQKQSTIKNICLDQVIIGNLDHLPFPDHQFDTAISLWVLEHLSFPHQVFSEINRVLKPQGLFAFVTPNSQSLLIWLRKLLNQKTVNYLVKNIYGRQEQDTFPAYYNCNTIKNLQEIAHQTGFSPVKLQTNFDPSYSSFNQLSYQISQFTYHLTSSIFHPHIVGIFRKTKDLH
jgi:ubiquinone/menaquinone biosynthesis C-methylase UbiE